MKYFTFFIAAIMLLMAFKISEIEKRDKVKTKVIYPKLRIWTSPTGGEEPEFNSPSFEWPSKKKAIYDIRLSTSKDFNVNLIEKERIPFAIFNPHKQLGEGTWYWQYKTNEGKWNPVDSFTISPTTPKFKTPIFCKFNICPSLL